MNRRAIVLGIGMSVAVHVAHADTVTDWNRIAENALLQANANAVIQARAVVTAHVAIFDAVNSITNEYRPYAVSMAVASQTSGDAAAAAAAHKILVLYVPSQTAYLDQAYAASLAAIPDGQSKTDGIALGESVAGQIVALRADDGFTLGGTYTPQSGPGFWQPTPPAFAPAAFVLLSTIRPWSLTSADEFRAKGPDPVTSKQFAADLAEVASVGAIASTTRTQYQTDSANFWYEGSVLMWNRIARPIAVSHNLSLTASARLFAQLGMAYMDGYIAGFDSKYTYVFWRPVTAIRATSDPTWTPLRITPAHPDYVSTHSVLGEAATQILERTFGRHVAFTTTGSSTAPTVVRSFNSFEEASIDNQNSRVWAGIHFRHATQDGATMGEKIGKQIYRKFLRPVDDDGDDDD